MNDVLVAEAAALLWQLLRDGRIPFHGAFFDTLPSKEGEILPFIHRCHEAQTLRWSYAGVQVL